VTITILKQGHREKKEDTSVTFNCRNCMCEFTATPPDYVLVRDEREGNYRQATCPTCEQIVTKSIAV